MKSTWELFLNELFFLNRTSEGVHVPSVVRGDGIQVNAAAALSLHMVALFTWTTNTQKAEVKYSKCLMSKWDSFLALQYFFIIHK